MRIYWVLAVILSAVTVAWGQPTPVPARVLAIPEGGTSIVAAGGVKAFRLGGRDPKAAQATLVDVADQPFGQALRLRTNTKPDDPWLIQARARSTVPLQKGDACLLTFSARAVETSDEMGEATLGVVFEHVGAPNTKSLEKSLKLNKNWRRFYIPFAMVEDEEADMAQCNLRIGYLPQTIEVADLQLLTYGKSRRVGDLPMQGAEVSYRGRETDAVWRKPAQERIEKFRKADLTVLVTDAAGKPVPNAEVKVEMRRHAYHFGAAVTAQMLTADTEDARHYRQLVQENFNAVVLENDLKYPGWTAGKTSARTAYYNDENTLDALRWLKEQGIYVRGHCLLWGPLDRGHYQATRGFDFDAADPTRNRQLLEEHWADILQATNGLVGEWDVVNHPVATWGDKGRCWTDLFGREFYADLYRRARAANPNMRLFINEGSDFPGDNESVRRRYEEMIAWLQEQNAPLDAIGFMSHFGATTLATPDYVYAHLERYAKFGLPMRSTELDVSTDGDEQVQADYLRDFMTMFFSHPQTDGIVMWGFWEGRHWKPDTALWRKNWELKPNGQAWLDLVKKQWWTREAGRTDAAGQFTLRGFKGTYTLTVAGAGRTQAANVTLDKEGTRCTVVLR